ncbi:PREDICTED: uncharacterized protein LOC109186197 [Ipomoea nil]|uniref:uncharacterized protein LOC109186197 n=1 Tax=Ipomoea nil TaxID=35883 RepID=UPI000900CB19|nr:PREDICTED: uncharacterized protein LOC109186197 [Ipomoea nil]
MFISPACSRIFCSIIIIVLGLLFLLSHHHHHHASVGFFGVYPADDHHHASVVVGDHILRRKMIATSLHVSPAFPRNLRKLLRTSPDKSTETDGDHLLRGQRTAAWSSDDATKKKLVGREFGVVVA